MSLVPVWLNGEPGSNLSLFDRGLAFGDGLFETIRVTSAGPVLFDYHLDRLLLGMEILGIEADTPQLEKELLSYPGLQYEGIVKIIITRGQGGRGYACDGVIGPNRIVAHFPSPEFPGTNNELGIRIYPCQTPLSSNLKLAGIKHLNRLDQVLARREWAASDNCQEGLMLNGDGYPIEGVFSNFFIAKNDVIMTPSLDSCGVAGTMRRWLLEMFMKHDYSVTEKQLTLADVLNADECFFCNSVYGIWPVVAFQSHTWPVGTLTRVAQNWARETWTL